MKTNIALIGMMGTSKSTCGKILADDLDLLFLDVDALIEYEEAPISQLFDRFGEECFRDIESVKIRRISSYENLVIATGGGVVKRAENMALLCASSYIILLTADSATILKRLKGAKNRPLLKRPKLEAIEALQAERRDLYLKYADIVVDTTGLTPRETVDLIRDRLYQLIQNQKKENGEDQKK